MTIADEHELLVQQIAAYAIGAVNTEDRDRLETHIAECSQCSMLVSEYSGVVALLPYGLPPQSPPNSAWQNISVGISGRRTASTAIPFSLLRWLGAGLPRQRLVATAFTSAAFVALLAILVSLAPARGDELVDRQVRATVTAAPPQSQPQRRPSLPTAAAGASSALDGSPTPEVTDSGAPAIVPAPPTGDAPFSQPNFDSPSSGGFAQMDARPSLLPGASPSATPRSTTTPAIVQALSTATRTATPASSVSRAATPTPSGVGTTVTPIPLASTATRTATATVAATAIRTATSTPQASGTQAALAAAAQPTPCAPAPVYSGTGPTPIPLTGACPTSTAFVR